MTNFTFLVDFSLVIFELVRQKIYMLIVTIMSTFVDKDKLKTSSSAADVGPQLHSELTLPTVVLPFEFRTAQGKYLVV